MEVVVTSEPNPVTEPDLTIPPEVVVDGGVGAAPRDVNAFHVEAEGGVDAPLEEEEDVVGMLTAASIANFKSRRRTKPTKY